MWKKRWKHAAHFWAGIPISCWGLHAFDNNKKVNATLQSHKEKTATSKQKKPAQQLKATEEEVVVAVGTRRANERWNGRPTDPA